MSKINIRPAVEIFWSAAFMSSFFALMTEMYPSLRWWMGNLCGICGLLVFCYYYYYRRGETVLGVVIAVVFLVFAFVILFASARSLALVCVGLLIVGGGATISYAIIEDFGRLRRLNRRGFR